MKKKNKKNQIRMRFSTILLCILAILLCAAPRGWADGSYKLYDGEICYLDDVEIFDVTEDLDWLEVGAGTTVNLYDDVLQSVKVYPGGILNIYSGNVGWFIIIFSSEDKPYAKVTVYGTNFEVDGVPLDSSATQFTVDSWNGGVLTGNYGGDGGPILPSLYKLGLWFISKIPIYLGTTDDPEVEIDIKPGSDLNSINLKSKGVVPVAVFTIAGGLDAGTIDPGTVLFAGASPVRWKLCDVDDDGDKDMLFHFKTQELVDLDEDSTEATLTGETNSGNVIAGTDTVRIVPTKK